ncbi:MAG TPA: hypothetical protein EYQ07_05925, partial [Candidatus Poseidoniales archaeon]|nr:hypothetical protein [Candidatus Poseidoniales archaeon]
DGKVRFWDFAAGTQPYRALSHAAPIIGIAIGDDGQRLVTGSRDGSIRVWQMPPKAPEAQRLHVDRVIVNGGGRIPIVAV